MHGFDDFQLHPEVFEFPPRQASQELLRAQIETDANGARLDSAAFRSRLRVAYTLGIPVLDLQRRTGVPRQTIYNAIKRPLGEDLDDLSVLALIAAGSAQTIDSLESVTGASGERIRHAISCLHREKQATALASTSGTTDPIGVFTVTAQGLTRLQTEIESERVRATHADAWTVFIAIPDGMTDALIRAAEGVHGSDGSVGVIDAKVAPSRMDGPELAVVARAVDSREVVVIVEGLWAMMRQTLERLPPQPRIVALSPPRR